MIHFKTKPLHLLSLILLPIAPIFAQGIDINHYSFIHTSADTLKFYGTATDDFSVLLDKSKKIHNGQYEQLRIVHIGDSHIQGGHLDNYMRTLIKSSSALCERGFIFPYPIAQSNNPANYRVNYGGQWSSLRGAIATSKFEMGLNMVTVSSSDPTAWLQIQQETLSPSTCPFSRIRLFHSIHNSPTVRILQKDNVLHQFTNDELGYTLFLLKEPMTDVGIAFDFNVKKHQSITIHGISLENDSAGFSYSAIGANGAEITTLLRSDLLEGQLLALRPDLIILSFGTNDVYRNTPFDAQNFQKQYQLLLNRIRGILPSVAVLLTTPGDALYNKTTPMPELQQAVHAILDVATTNHCAVWDFYTIMGGYGSIKQWFDAGLTNSDKLHFLRAGYEIQATLLYQALTPYLSH
ncbi:hypothetical protein FACS1894201_03360 [Bacteroidia bacterium]|nr:hypothetical protein FACS1894201_03360 [Bacteroidia bacterium]